MKKYIWALIFLIGCGTPGYIRADAIEGTVTAIIDRHDAYVDNDPSLKELERRIYKRGGELIKMLIEEAQRPSEAPEEE